MTTPPLLFPAPAEWPCEFCGKTVLLRECLFRTETEETAIRVRCAHARCVRESPGDMARPLTLRERRALMERFIWVPLAAGAVAGTLISWLVRWAVS